jgi:SAM-dependent methyltransferase
VRGQTKSKDPESFAVAEKIRNMLIRDKLEIAKFCALCDHTILIPEMSILDWNLVRCAHCGLVFTSPGLAADHLRDLYENQYYEQTQHYFVDQLSGPSGDEILFAQSLKKRVWGNRKGTPRFLDVGCGAGRQLEAFIRGGREGVGLDISEKANQAGVRKGLDLRPTGLSSPSLGFFDLIGAFHVLEHMPSPKAFLENCVDRLTAQGYLIIEIPDYHSRSARRMRHNWPYLYPHIHLYQFTGQSIGRYLDQANFRRKYSGSTKNTSEIAGEAIQLRPRRNTLPSKSG